MKKMVKRILFYLSVVSIYSVTVYSIPKDQERPISERLSIPAPLPRQPKDQERPRSEGLALPVPTMPCGPTDQEVPRSECLELPDPALPSSVPSRGISCCPAPCPIACPTCNPCVPECLISGCFRVADIYPCPDLAPVVDQRGCKFIVTPLGDGKYLVSLVEPFCKPVVVTASKSNTFPLDDVSNVVTVLSNPTSPTDSFILGNIQCGDFVCFHAVPVEVCF